MSEGGRKGTRVRTVWFPDVALASSSVQHSHSMSPQKIQQAKVFTEAQASSSEVRTRSRLIY